MGIAIFGDIHGNSIALDTVLNDIGENSGVDEYWLLGDYAAIGHDPLGCVQRVSGLPNAKFVRGNTDRYICNDLVIGEDFKKVLDRPEKALQMANAHRSFVWTQGAIAASGWMDWFKYLPLEHRARLPDGSEMLIVHASPGSDDSAGLHPKSTDSQLEDLFAKDAADLIIVGHTHVPMNIEFKGKQLLNASSVSNPFPPDLDANYLILDADKDGYSIERYSVPYDHLAVIEAAKKVQHPAAAYIEGFMRGTNIAGWID
jgi:predicted phosphodiesterase